MVETIEMKSPYRKDLEKKQKRVLELYEKYTKQEIPQMQVYSNILRDQKAYKTVQGVIQVLRRYGIDAKCKTNNKKNERRTIEKGANEN